MVKNTILALGLGLSFTSCATNSSKNHNLNLDTVKTEETIYLKVGNQVNLEVTSNPSTGYDWFASEQDECNVKIVGKETKSNNKNDEKRGIVGAPSKDIFRLLANEKGECTIRFDYKRGWEDTVSESKKIKFIVR